VGVTSYKENGGGQQKFEGGGTDTITYNGQSVVVPAGFKADTETSKNNRDGVSAMLQYRPNKDFKTSVDLFYSPVAPA
jgi:iron complex outermembrane receptor protein